MKFATMKRAARYGVRILQAQHEDMDGDGYSRQMRNDLELAIAMLKAAPDIYHALPSLLGFVEAGGIPEVPMLRHATERAAEAYIRGLDRKRACLLDDC